jgi:SAM-dependent methyltransferase
MSALYADGRLYDLLYADPEGGEDVDFVLAMARNHPGPVVELACGTGRFIVPLARQGHDVIGLDSSGAMLAEARAKSTALDLSPRLVEGDMRDFALDVSASLVFIAGNSLCHLLTNDDVDACFTSVRRHLASDGRFLIDVFVPEATLLARSPEGRFEYGDYEHPDGGRVEVTYSVRYDKIAQINDVTLFGRHGNDAEENLGTLRMRMFFPQELRALLLHHGFRIENMFGDFRRTPLDTTAAKQVLICTLGRT